MKEYGETTVLSVDDDFDDEGFLLFDIEGESAWVSFEEVVDLIVHLQKVVGK